MVYSQVVIECFRFQFAEAQILNLENLWEESDNKTPMICFLSMGSDPTESIEKLAKKHGLVCKAISMGQGQEIHARKLLSNAMAEGAHNNYAEYHSSIIGLH